MKHILFSALIFITLSATAQTFENFTTVNGLINNNVYSVCVDQDNNKYFGTSSGVSVFDGTNWNNTSVISTVNAIYKDSNDTIWLGVINNGVWASTDFTNYNYYSAMNGLINNWVNVITPDNDGNLWIGTNQGASLIAGGNITNYNTENGLAGYAVLDIKVTGDGKVWFATEQGISCLFNGEWSYITTTDGLVSNDVTAIESDNSGNVWYGTDGYGISVFNGTSWHTYTTTDGLSNNTVTDLLWIDETMWVGTMSGLNRFKNNIWTKYFSWDGIVGNYIKKMDVDNEGNPWIGTTEGVTKITVTSGLSNVNNQEIYVYPNPAAEKLNINLNDNTNTCTISVYDLAGKLVIDETTITGNNYIDISSLKSGIYTIKTKSENYSGSIKLVKN